MAVGTVFAAWHTIWVILVGVGWAAQVLNFILELHFLKIGFQLAPYSAFTAYSLVAITFCVGALLGAIFAVVWNWLTAASEPEWAHHTKTSAATTN
ncbi:MAG TPA: hypothetical protein VM308_02190 [Sphingomicrobium sp.]|nr:hypothetical protein [Sphingomicrobium sp.]